MKLLLVLLVVLCSEGVLTAPVMEEKESEGSGCSALHSCDDNTFFNETLSTQEDLKDALVNNSENLEKIKFAFTLKPDEVKLCITVNYTITCTDKTRCQVDCENNCYIQFIWTSFDTFSLSGSFLYYFAGFHVTFMGFEIPGFEWGEACDLNKNILNLSIEAPSLVLQDNFFETLTKQVGHSV